MTTKRQNPTLGVSTIRTVFCFSLFGVLLVSKPVSARLHNATLPETPPGGVWTVCTGSNEPFATCTLGSQPTIAAGYSIEVFKRVAVYVGLRPDQYKFQCMNYTDMVNDLTDPNGTCDITAAGFTFTSARLAEGIKFVYPETYRTGLIVMVHASVKRGGQWLFLKPFKWEVWMLLLCAAIAVGISVHLVEVVSKRYMNREVANELRLNGEGGFSDSLWAAIAQVANAGDPLGAVSFPSRLIIFVWCFMILLLLTMYTGNAAAILTTTSINTDITTATDLRGRNWGAYVGSKDVLANQGLVPTRLFPLNTDEEHQAAYNALLNDEVEALVFECALVSYLTSFICDLQQIGNCFVPSDQGLTFWQNASDKNVALAGQAVLALEDGGDLDRLRQSFITPASSSCDSALQSGTQSVTFLQVSGLWIVLAVAIGIAFLWSLVLHQIHKHEYFSELRKRALRRRGSRRRSQSDVSELPAVSDAPAAGSAKRMGIGPEVTKVDVDAV